MTIIEFIRDRLAEDELVARDATPGPWLALPQRADRAVYCVQAVGALNGLPALGIDSVSDAEHIAFHDPARVLLEVEAKRRIVDWVEAQAVPGSTIGDDFLFPLFALAAVYVDHPDYDPAWTPA